MIDFFIQVVKNLNISDAFSSENCFADFFATIYSLLIHNRKTPSFRSRYYVLCLFNNRGVPYTHFLYRILDSKKTSRFQFKSAILAIFQFFQNGTFEPVHEIWNFFDQKYSSEALGKCQ